MLRDYWSGWQSWFPGNSQRFIVRFYDESPQAVPAWGNPVRQEIIQGKFFLEELVWDYYYLWKVELDLATPLALNSGWISTQIDMQNGAGGSFQHLEAIAGDIDGHALHRYNSSSTYTINGDIQLEIWGSMIPQTLESPVLNISRDGSSIQLN